MPSILFVCTANQCRSPMAEVCFKAKLAQAGTEAGWAVDSAAAWGLAGSPATPHAREVAAQHGLSLDAHRSQRVDDLILDNFDLILVMERDHQEALRAEFPSLADRIHTLAAMSGPDDDVVDPVGGDLEAYRSTWREIEALIEQGFPTISERVGQAH